MQETNCSYESAVVASMHSDRWDGALLGHLETCSHCAELAQIMEWTRTLTTDAQCPPLGDPDLLWLKSQYLQAEAAQRRRMRKFLILQIGCVALLVTSAALLAVGSQSFQAMLSGMLTLGSQIENIEQVGLKVFPLLGVTSIAAVLIVAAIALVIQPLFGED